MKRTLRIIVSVLLIISLLCSVAIAELGGAKGPKYDKEVQKVTRMVDKANKDILREIRKAQATIRDDVDQMMRKIDRIIANVMAYANRVGVTVMCEYKLYTVDGRDVWIDPLHVVNV